jgi:hypothetical protein
MEGKIFGLGIEFRRHFSYITIEVFLYGMCWISTEAVILKASYGGKMFGLVGYPLSL